MATASQDEWLKRVLGLDVPTAAAVLNFVQLTERLTNIRDDAATTGLLPGITDQLRAAAQAVKQRAPTALNLVDELENHLADLIKTQRQLQVQATIAQGAVGGLGAVAFARMRLQLEAARNSYDDAIDNLKIAWEALLETEDFIDDPRSSDPATLQAIATIETRVPSFADLADKVNDAIDKMVSALDADARAKLGTKALGEVDTFKARLDKVALLTEMQDTDAGSFPIHSAMVAALNDLAGALRG